jgi:cell shape-determining protein MreC
MFGLTKREQRWKAEQQAAEALLGFGAVVIGELAAIKVAEAKADANELKRLRLENAELQNKLLKKQNIENEAAQLLIEEHV